MNVAPVSISRSFSLRNYYLLTKPGIIMGNLITVVAGFMLAARGEIDVKLLFATLTGLSLVIASACVFNNFIDREIDRKMERTKERALAKGLIPNRNAILFAIFLGLSGHLILFFFTNPLTWVFAAAGFLIYVLLYSPCKSRTVYATAIGSLSGAVPPVVGYCAVTNQFDVGALLLFAIMVFWQMPHFFAIAMYRLQDYAAASIPVLPVKKGMQRTKLHMLFYVVGFVIATLMLTCVGYTGYVYLAVVSLLGGVWLWLSLKGFKSKNDGLWARDMFRWSLIVITALSLVIPFDFN